MEILQNTESISQFIAELRERQVNLHVNDGNIKYRAPKGSIENSDLLKIKQCKNRIIDILENEKVGKRMVYDAEHKYEPFPLTDVQAAYLLGRKKYFKYGDTSCHIYLEVEYPLLEKEKVEEIWNFLIKRHGMLRVIFDDSGYQRVLKEVPEYRINYNNDKKAEDSLLEARNTLGHKIYEIDKWPLYDIGLVNFQNKSIIYISIDLLIADWASIWMILDEFEILYSNRAEQLPRIKSEFRDYVINIKKTKSMPKYFSDRKYWMDRIDKFFKAPDLPIIDEKSNELNVSFKRYNLELNEEEWRNFVFQAKKNGVTPSATILSIYAKVIEKWSTTSKFVLNLTLLNRQDFEKETENLVGDFTSVNLLEVDFSKTSSFIDCVKRVQEQLFTDLDHREFSGVEVLRELAKVNGKEEAFMPIVFTSGIGTIKSSENKILKGRFKKEGISQTPQVFIDCQVMDQNEKLIVNWDVRENIFPANIIEDMFKAFETCIHKIALNEEEWNKNEVIYIPKWQEEQRKEVNNNLKNYEDKLLHQMVIEQCILTPEKQAVIDEENIWSYRELIEHAYGISNELRRIGCEGGKLVAIAIPKSVYQVAAVLGVLMCKSAYVPIDISQPDNRKSKIIEEGKIEYLLTLDETKVNWAGNINIVTVKDKLSCKVDLNQCLKENKDSNAYVIFTSGSTGLPKGVVMNHYAVTNTIKDVNQMFSVGSDDKLLGLAKLSFDLSVYDIFGILSVGGTLIYPNESKMTDPSYWFELLLKHKITIWNSVPAMMQMLIDFIENVEVKEKINLKTIFMSGDWIPLQLPDKIKTYVPKAKIVSLGGATEAGIWSIYYIYDMLNSYWKSIPYGKPLANQQFHVLNDKLEDCPILVKGELYISGKGLAEKYLNDIGLTNSHFIYKDSIRLYRTGDLGRYMKSGDIEFLGREDTQIKINGHRIELGEVQNIAKKYPQAQNVCIVTKKIGNEKKIIAYVVKEKGLDISDEAFIKNIKLFLKENLPLYMVPHIIEVIFELPLTSNGKVDRNLLTNKEVKNEEEFIDRIEGLEENNFCGEMHSEVYLSVNKIWSNILDVDKISAKEDLYQLGADSLVMAQAAGRIRKYLLDSYDLKVNFDIILKQLLNEPNIEQLVTFIEKSISGDIKDENDSTEINEKSNGYITIHKKSEKDLVQVIFHAGLGTVNEFDNLIQHLAIRDKGTIVSIAVRNIDKYCSIKSEELIESIADDYVNLISEYSDKKIQLIGHCIGGMIAFEVAKRLTEKGIIPFDVVLIDSIPGYFKITDSIFYELMFLPVMGVQFKDISMLHFEEREFFEYLNWNAEKNKSLILRKEKEDEMDSRYSFIMNDITVLKNMEYEKRFEMYMNVIENNTKKKYKIEMIESLYKMFKKSSEAASYKSVPYIGSVRLLKAEEMGIVVPERPESTINHWKEICIGDLESIMIQGNHFSCISNRESAKVLSEIII